LVTPNTAPIPLLHAFIAAVLGALVGIILIFVTAIYIRLGVEGIRRLCWKGSEDIDPTMVQQPSANYSATALDNNFDLIERREEGMIAQQQLEIRSVDIARANRLLAASPASQHPIVLQSRKLGAPVGSSLDIEPTMMAQHAANTSDYAPDQGIGFVENNWTATSSVQRLEVEALNMAQPGHLSKAAELARRTSFSQELKNGPRSVTL